MNEAEKLQALKEVLDGGEQTYLCCAAHNYIPRSSPGIEKIALLPPMNECKDCAFVYLLTMFAMMPPHVRRERLEMLEAGTRHLIEAEKRGERLNLYKHPEITIEREH